jgi:VanZ family protein
MSPASSIPGEGHPIQEMNPFFAVLAAAYIFGIFFFSDSSVVSRISEFNPYSLLHIPLYGLLTVLLLLTFIPKPGRNLSARYQVAAWIAAVAVGILDEYHQCFIPSREASVTDVLLDILGTGLVMLLAWRFPPHRWTKPFEKLGWRTR